MEHVADAQPRNRRKTDQTDKLRGVRVRVLNAAMLVLAIVVSVLFLVTVQQASATYNRFEDASDNYVVAEHAANDMKAGSNYLTSQIRLYAMTGNQEHLDNYYREVESGRRENAVAVLQEQTMSDAHAANHLQQALSYSDELKQIELYAAVLLAQGRGDSLAGYGSLFEDVRLSSADKALDARRMVDLGTSMVFDDEYQGYVDRIEDSVSLCKDDLLEGIMDVRDREAQNMRGLLLRLIVLAVVLLAVFVLVFLLLSLFLLRPLRENVSNIMRNGELPMKGAYELRYLSHAYNIMRADNLEAHAQLLRKAERDHLTDLYNRGVFESTLASANGNTALLLIDFDHFKDVNDTYGHDVGDAMLKKVSSLLVREFRMTDYPCRIGGDEFAVVMVDVSPDLKDMVAEKIEALRKALLDTSDGLPAATLSVGVAFNDGSLDSAAFFKRADETLYTVKESGRNNYAFAE